MRWVLFLLFLIYVCNTMDRHVLAILAEPIRLDLGLNDTQLGLLTGLVFALFYTVFGIPVGWLADRFGRTRVIMIACAVWSVCSAMGGLASNFTQLALARVGVGIGEAGGSAPSYSLISSFYPPHRRGQALGLYHLGAPVATLLVAVIGAWIAGIWGWRAAVIGVSCPGVVVALLLVLTVKDPPVEPQPEGDRISLLSDIKAFLFHPLLPLVGVTAGLSSFTQGAISAWVPAFLMRVKLMPLGDLGLWYAPGNAIAFGLGLWFGGFLSDRLAGRGNAAYALVPCAGLVVAMPFLILAVLAPGWGLSLGLWLAPTAAVGMFLAPAVALVQKVAPPHRRAMSGALFLLLNYLIGNGLGPLYVGMISDAFAPRFGAQSLGIGLMACFPVLVIAIGMQLFVAHRLRQASLQP